MSEERPGGWPETSIYRDPYHYELLAQMTAPADVPFYLGLVEERGGPVLELACGTGRVSLPIARSGARVVGLDRSEPMLDYARARAALEGLEVEFLLGDMRDFALEPEAPAFALILLPYNAFNHLYTLADVSGFLAAVRRHMGPGTRLVIDTFNPDPARLDTDPVEPRKILEYIEPLTGHHVKLFEEARYDTASQVNEVTWHYEVDGEADAWIDHLPMRIFYPQELDALLCLNGLVIERKLGDYEGTPFSSRTSKQLVLCRAA